MHREQGGNVQALMEPDGFPLWLSEVEPGSTHDITAARQHQVLDVDNRTYNTLLRGLRCLGERAFALLVGRWRALRHITTVS